MFKQSVAGWCVPPRPEGQGTGLAEQDAWRLASWQNTASALAYETWLLFEAPQPKRADAPFAFVWQVRSL